MTDDDAVTKPQLTYLAMLRSEEYPDNETGRADWFRWVHTNVGRTVISNKQLTKAEASALIDVLLHDEAMQ